MNQEAILRFEVMDRTLVMQECVASALTGHTGLTPKTTKALAVVEDALNKMYQAASEEFDEAMK